MSPAVHLDSLSEIICFCSPIMMQTFCTLYFCALMGFFLTGLHHRSCNSHHLRWCLGGSTWDCNIVLYEKQCHCALKALDMHKFIQSHDTVGLCQPKFPSLATACSICWHPKLKDSQGEMCRRQVAPTKCNTWAIKAAGTALVQCTFR